MFNKKRILLILFGISLLAISFIVYMGNKNKKTASGPKVIPETGAAYKNLTPGKSTSMDVTNSLGAPKNQTLENGQNVFEYDSNNPNFPNKFYVNNNQTLGLVKETVAITDNVSITDLEKKYGPYEYVLYGPSSNAGYDLFVYPNKGIAYFGHLKSGLVDEIWYFPPTIIENFKSQYAQNYSDTPSGPSGQ